MIVRTLLILAVLTFSSVGTAQVYWSKQIDWERQNDYLSGVIEVDSFQKFIAVGGSLNLTPYQDNFFLTIFDASGEVIDSSVFLPLPSISGNASRILKINENFSLIQGNAYLLNPDGLEDIQIFFVKLDNLTGDTIWSKQYGKNNFREVGWQTILTSDSGFAVIGWTWPGNNSPPEKILFLKVDSMGNQVFRKEFSINSLDSQRGWAITEAVDSGFILSCSTTYKGICTGCSPMPDYMNDLLIIKTDASGNQDWVKSYPPLEWKQYSWGGFDITFLRDSTYIVFGNKYYHAASPSFNHYSKYMLWHFGVDGSLLDSTSFGGGDGTLITSIISTKDNNFLATATENDSSFTGIGQTGILLKISPSLQLLWKKEYHISPPGVTVYEKFYDSVQLPDQGFIVCGRAYDTITNSNGWLIRVDSFGCLEPGCQLNSAIEDPPAPALDIGITFSPNPTSGQVRLALTHEGAVLLGVRVLDLQGRVVSDIQYLRNAGWRECTLDLSMEPAGVYVVQVRTSEGWAVREIMVAR